MAATVLVGVAAAVLAARSLPERAATPPPAPTPTPVFAAPVRFVADAAADTEWAYALLASCIGPETTRQCRYQVLRRRLAGGGWTTTAIRTDPVAGAAGLARLFVTADRVTVVDQPTVGNVLTSTDGGATVTRAVLAAGPRVAAVPAGAVVDLGLCDSCLNQLTVLEPRTGRLQPLAQPPPLGSTAGIRSFAESGGVLWALSGGGSRMVSAVSLDRGRTWRVLPVGAARAPADITWLVSDGGRGAYLLVSRDDRPDVEAEFSELWRVGDASRPGAAWRQVTPATRPRTARGVLVADGVVLVRDETGQLWRLGPDGVMEQLPPIRLDGVPTGLDRVVAGPGRLLLGIVNRPDDTGPPRILLSSDGGGTWRVEKLPG